ncbi:ribonucleoside-diphosphate reductase small chain [Hibiscus syriacus]|uniref:Ribonucleoside-diphosphate reductase small chain n=1 Tax=Hibiscus syriacus TaxID=106335 RepID=A0A6A2ZRL0_HIBSY|nr:ribonucleoside-diphosphate reductase small chain [Hibiscus syriacus]
MEIRDIIKGTVVVSIRSILSSHSQPDFKERIVEAVNDKQEPVAVTTAVQEEIFLEMGVVYQAKVEISFVTETGFGDPSFGLACLGKVNITYENDQDLMIRHYRFVADEELACDEAELGPDEFAEKLHSQQKLHEQQLQMLKYMRKFHLDDQSAILEKLHHQMEDANFDVEASILSSEQIQEIVQRRVSPLFRPR